MRANALRVRQTRAIPSLSGQNAFEAELRVQFRHIRHQRNVGAIKGVSVQPGDQLLHHQPAKAFSPGEPDRRRRRQYRKLISAVAERCVPSRSASPARGYVRHNSYAAVRLWRLPGARRHAGGYPQVAKRFGGGHLLDHGIFNGHVLVSRQRGDKSRGTLRRKRARKTRINAALMRVSERLRTDGYLPIQKLEKMRPSRSSEVNSPVTSLSACCARRSSSASSSPAQAPSSWALPCCRWFAASFQGLQSDGGGRGSRLPYWYRSPCSA